MGHRLSKIYTRTGDKGTTGMADGSRLDKDSARVEAIGAVDELNCQLGALLARDVADPIRRCLTRVQNELFDLGGELALPAHPAIDQALVERLEAELDSFNVELPPLKEFILPGGSPAAAEAHLARAVCRRAERRLVSLARAEPLGDALLAYLNRLSDLLFVLARTLARAAGGAEVMWQPRGGRGKA